MPHALHTLQSPKGATRKRKRVGRGNASGTGTYAGRGLKGQRARSGASGFTRRGLKPFLTQKPKLGGFKGPRQKYVGVNLRTLEAVAKDGETIDVAALVRRKIVDSKSEKVKILGSGIISKEITVIADAFSKSAQAAITKAGGTAKLRNQK